MSDLNFPNVESKSKFELGVAAHILLEAYTKGWEIDPDTLAFIDAAVESWWDEFPDEIDRINTM